MKSLWLYTKHLMDIFTLFWIRWPSNFEKYQAWQHWKEGIGVMALSLFCIVKRKSETKVNIKVKMLFIILAGQPWWPTVFSSLPWPHHFEIYFIGPEYSVFNQLYGFSANNSTFRNAILPIFSDLRGHRFLDAYVSNFVFSDVSLSL